MKALLAVITWGTAFYALFGVIPPSTTSNRLSACDEVKQELVQGVNRRELTQQQATDVYERCLSSVGVSL